MKGINLEEQARKVSQLIAKYGADEGFKRKLLADPAATLKAEGVEVPAGLSTKAPENTDIAPAKSAALSDEDLDLVAGGSIVGAALDVAKKTQADAFWAAVYRRALEIQQQGEGSNPLG